MMFEHLTIAQLSDLIDDSLAFEEKHLVLEHIRVCETCRCEYESLSQCVAFMSGLRNEAFQLPDICEKTILICRSRERRRLYIKSIPAIAASVMIIAGAGIIKTGMFTTDNRAVVAANVPVQSETQFIINAIRDSNGRIVSMTSDYIDGEIEGATLAGMENYLHSNHIKHSIIPVNYGDLPVKNRNLTNASVESGNSPDMDKVQIFKVKNSSRVTVRFYKD